MWDFANLTVIIRRSCCHSSASDFAYSYPFLCSVVCCLSVVCHTVASCLNRLTDIHLAVALAGSNDTLC